MKLTPQRKQAALKVLSDTVYNPVFFKRLEQYGIQTPRSKEQADELLKSAALLRQQAMQSGLLREIEPPTPEATAAALRFTRDNKTVKTAALIYKKLISK